MKQALLITAYKDYKSLRQLVYMFHDAFYVFIHVDKKSKTISETQVEELNNMKHCTAIKKYCICWGAYAHLCAVKDLLYMAAENGDISYVHIITGEDYPVVPVHEIEKRFVKDTHIYMSVMYPKQLNKEVTVRYEYYNWFIDKDVRNPLLWQIQKMTVLFQKLIGIKRNSIGEFTSIYKGLIYTSMPMEVVRYILTYMQKHPEYEKDLRSCQLPEEFFFQTLLMNSKYAGQVRETDLRYMDWNKGDGSSPSYLDMSDYENIEAGDYIFARKFHPEISKELKNKYNT